MTNEYTYPPDDRCIYGSQGWQCGKPEAIHGKDWREGGELHTFTPPEGKPLPERQVSCHIQTDWTCSFCGEDNDVWGEATGWMECGKCMKDSYLVPFM